MFKNNKYTRWYWQIVSSAKQSLDQNLGAREKHHIVPRSLGGADTAENLVALSARAHLICHRLLVRMLDGKEQQKMMWALHLMLFSENPHQTRYKVPSRVYEKFRHEFYSTMRGVPRIMTAEHKKNIAAANSKRLKGAKFSPEVKAKMSESHKGIRPSEESLRKRSETMKRTMALKKAVSLKQ